MWEYNTTTYQMVFSKRMLDLSLSNLWLSHIIIQFISWYSSIKSHENYNSNGNEKEYISNKTKSNGISKKVLWTEYVWTIWMKILFSLSCNWFYVLSVTLAFHTIEHNEIKLKDTYNNKKTATNGSKCFPFGFYGCSIIHF